MAYASTRIKKVAAAAFESETIETDEFCIKKPDGFLTMVGGDPKYAFESYSKEFGDGDAKEIRKAQARLTICEGQGVSKVVKGLKSGVQVKSDFNEVVNELTYRVLEFERIEKDIPYTVLIKIIERLGKVFVFEIDMLAAAEPEFKEKAESLLAGFSVK